MKWQTEIRIDAQLAEMIVMFLRRVTPHGTIETDWLLYAVDHLDHLIELHDKTQKTGDSNEQ